MHSRPSKRLLALASVAVLTISANFLIPGQSSFTTAQAQDTRPVQKVRFSSSPSTRERAFTAYITGYSYWDNTPPGSAIIARPVIHSRAGGTGTYQDPITIAVGHAIRGGRHTMNFPTGTRFYLKRLRKYAIVEDLCGDGPTPQKGPCYSGYRGRPWLDIYVGGSGYSAGKANACSKRVTALQTVIMNPGPGHPVVSGELTASGCRVFSG